MPLPIKSSTRNRNVTLALKCMAPELYNFRGILQFSLRGHLRVLELKKFEILKKNVLGPFSIQIFIDMQ